MPNLGPHESFPETVLAVAGVLFQMEGPSVGCERLRNRSQPNIELLVSANTCKY